VYWSKFFHTNKQTCFKKQPQFKLSYCSSYSIISRAFAARFPFLFALILLLLGCGAGAAGNLSSAPSVAQSVSGSPPPGSAVLSQPSVSLLNFGSAGFGGDDTSVLQNAVKTTAASGQVLRIPAGKYNVNPISFPDNSQVALDAGVTITANAGYGPSDKMLNIKSQNVTIAGAGATSVIFQMRKAEYAAEHAVDGSEYRHCLNIEGASNVKISGISCNQSGGDGLYIGAASLQGAPSQNVTISDCIFDQNFRQGFSLISGEHVFIYRSYFTNTSGTNPEAGIDVEPNNPSDVAADVHIEDSFTTGNAGPGVKLSIWKLTGASQAVDITVLRHHSNSNLQSGYDANNSDLTVNTQGQLLVRDSFSENDGDYGVLAHWWQATGPALIFQNLSITNPHQKGPDPTYHDSAAVGVRRGGGGQIPLGNVQFQGVNIAMTNGKVDRYFNFEDNSGKGVEKTIFNPGNLSGATQVPPNGLVQSSGFNTVNP
jgi:hypothetical protein